MHRLAGLERPEEARKLTEREGRKRLEHVYILKRKTHWYI